MEMEESSFEIMVDLTEQPFLFWNGVELLVTILLSIPDP
jgi:hypothetical protein